MTPPVSLADVYQARNVVRHYLPPTPLFAAPGLSRRTGADVHIKYENMSPIRSFKARGPVYCLSRLPADQPGVACASTGNHGQGMALAARWFGKRAVVVVPHGTNERKMAAILHFGADLRIDGQHLEESVAIARRIAAEEHLVYVEDGEHPDVMVGCATLALDLIEQLPDVDALLVPVGGGNLIAACGLVVKALRPDAKLVGVQSEAAPAVYESWKQGASVHLDQCATFAGGIATSYPCHFTFPYIRSYVDEMALVSDDALIEAARVMLEETGHLPEGAGAGGLAALLADPARFAGQMVVLLLTGSNFESRIWDRLRGCGQSAVV
ncbi:MAG: threonine ammonia-lyase [Thermomicrobiales bacterium]